MRAFIPPLLLLAACQTMDADSATAVKGVVAAADGVEIAYEARGSGSPTLLFVHGWCCDRSHWRNQLDVFAADHRVVAIDLPGHGASGADRNRWTLEGLARDVQSVAETLDLERVVIVGHSMGGPVALMAAQRMPDRVVGIIGVDTLHNAEIDYSGEQFQGFARGFEADFDGMMERAVRSMFTESADPAVVESVLVQGKATDRRAALGLINAFADLDLRQAMSSAKVPVRCINAANMPTEREINRRYADFDVAIMEDVGHYVMLERSQEFNERLRAALAAMDL